MRMNAGDVTWVRLAVCLFVGLLVAFATSTLGHPVWAPMAGWVAASTTFCAWTWLGVATMDAPATQAHATREDAGRAIGDLVLVVASLAALVGVGFLLAANTQKGSEDAQAVLGVLAVVGSWFVVHTLFALRYARLYCNDSPGGIDFGGDEDPTYADFAYLAFTIGMTYQVSDTTLQTRAIRHTALRHALISFLLGAVILAVTINLVVQLASTG